MEPTSVQSPQCAEAAAAKPSTISEHVSAVIGSRSYLWTLAALAGILVFSSMLGTTGNREQTLVARAPGRPAAAAAAAVAAGPQAAPASLSSGEKRRGKEKHRLMKPHQRASLVRPRDGSGSSAGSKGNKDGGQRSPPAAEDSQLAETGEPEYIRRIEGCRSTVCRWQGEYLGGKLDETVHPCVDFYSYACPGRWFQQDTLAALPYRLYTAGQLMYRLENMFHEVRQTDSDGEASGKNASFLERAAKFFLRCISKESSRGPWSDLEELYRYYGLENYPFRVSSELPSTGLPNLTRVVGTLDRELGLSALFRASLTTARRRKQATKSTLVFLDPAESTPSLRLQSALGREDDEILVPKVVAGLSILKTSSGGEYNDEAAQVLAVDKELSRVIHLANLVGRSQYGMLEASVAVPANNDGSAVRPPAPISVQKLAEDYDSSGWSWELYAETLLGDVVLLENSSADPRILVQVDRPEQLEKLSELFGHHDPAALLNFVGFSLTVFLSPALPQGSATRELLVLSHGEHIPQVPEELQACVHLLARTYRFGALSLARHAVSHGSVEAKNYMYENEMGALVDGAREQVAALLRNGTSWMTATELWTALQRLDTLRVVFLAEPDGSMEHVSRYYRPAIDNRGGVGRPAAQLHESGLAYLRKSNASEQTAPFSAFGGPQATFLRECVSQHWETNALYWNSLDRPEENLEARWPPLHLKPRTDYFEARNTLLVSPSLVSILSGLLVGIDPLVVPMLGSDVLRGLLSVLLSSQRSAPAAGRGTSRRDLHVGGRAPTKRRESVMRCLRDQYANVTGLQKVEPHVPAELFVDSAIVDPLFALYRDYLEKYPDTRDGPNIPELPGKSALELFFINYAVAHCEQAPHLPVADGSSAAAASRVNVALMNSKAFSNVFHCKEDDIMNARTKCNVW